ncbi:DUF6510 family protein [Streptomyces ureilyticus]|uniref:DUF6510 family protein n=1 Tax=Streptomyces ureilyticus TaxID=1775131 RepID=UPI0038B4F2E7
MRGTRAGGGTGTTRCPARVRLSACDHVILRLVRSPDKAWLDLRGTVALTFPLGT